MRTTSVSGLAIASLLSGCAGHLTLEAPAPNAPEGERLRAYQRLRPIDRSVSRESRLSDDPGEPSRTSHRTDFILLGDGQKVEHVGDLLPVVPSDSEMAKDARASSTYGWLGTGLIVLGIATAAAAGTYLFATEHDYPPPVVWYGAAISGVLTSAGVGARVHSGHRASRAFTAYDLALKRRLDLCERRGVLATCKHLPPVLP